MDAGIYRMKRKSGSELIVKLIDPAVITKADGSARLGAMVAAQLTQAVVETSTVRFAVASGQELVAG